MNDYEITTQRLGLRRWKEADLGPFAEMNGDKAVMEFFPALLSESESMEMLNRIKTHFETNGFGLYAVDSLATGKFMGFTGFSIPRFESDFTPCIEIGWRYKKDAWGQGFATEAAIACLQHGFEVLHFEKVVSFTAVDNTKSEKVMKRTGMTKVGYFDHPGIELNHRLYRHVLYEIKREDFSNSSVSTQTI